MFNIFFYFLITFIFFLSFSLLLFLSPFLSLFLSILLSFFLPPFLPFLLSHVADMVLVLWPGVRLVPLRWESRVQDIGPPETSWLHVISNGKSSPRDLHLNAKSQPHSMTSKLQCWTPYATQDKTQLHPLAERLAKIIIRSQTPQNTPLDKVLCTRKTRSSLIHQNTGTSPLHQEAYTTH